MWRRCARPGGPQARGAHAGATFPEQAARAPDAPRLSPLRRLKRARRLALLHYTAAPVTGGVESVLSAHAHLLREAGHDVRVIAGRGDAELVPEVDSRHPEVEAVSRRLGRGDDGAPEFQDLCG